MLVVAFLGQGSCCWWWSCIWCWSLWLRWRWRLPSSKSSCMASTTGLRPSTSRSSRTSCQRSVGPILPTVLWTPGRRRRWLSVILLSRQIPSFSLFFSFSATLYSYLFLLISYASRDSSSCFSPTLTCHYTLTRSSSKLECYKSPTSARDNQRNCILQFGV